MGSNWLRKISTVCRSTHRRVGSAKLSLLSVEAKSSIELAIIEQAAKQLRVRITDELQRTMIKKITHLVMLAAVALSCSVASAQEFTFINPFVDLGIANGGVGPINDSFDISGQLGLGVGSVILNVNNGFTNPDSPASSFAVSGTQSVAPATETSFFLTGTTDVLAQVSHGQNLGSEAFADGALSRDGIRTAFGESFQLVSQLDSDFQAGFTPNASGVLNSGNVFVDYIGDGGPDPNVLESNDFGNFIFQSDAAVSNFTVFSLNTNDFNNNFQVGFAVASVPEPAGGLLFAVATGLIGLRRNRRS